MRRESWSGPCKEEANSHTMKKRQSSNSQEASAHPNLINYLALIHAVTHPGNRQDPGKRHGSHKSPAGAVAVS